MLAVFFLRLNASAIVRFPITWSVRTKIGQKYGDPCRISYFKGVKPHVKVKSAIGMALEQRDRMRSA